MAVGTDGQQILDGVDAIPLGITFAIKMIPSPVLAECRARAQNAIQNGKPVSRAAGAVIGYLVTPGGARHGLGIRSIRGLICAPVVGIA